MSFGDSSAFLLLNEFAITKASPPHRQQNIRVDALLTRGDD